MRLSKLEVVEGKITELKDIPIETIQIKKRIVIRIKLQRISDLWGNFLGSARM